MERIVSNARVFYARNACNYIVTRLPASKRVRVMISLIIFQPARRTLRARMRKLDAAEQSFRNESLPRLDVMFTFN